MLGGWYCRSLANEQAAEQQAKSKNETIEDNDNSDSESQDNDDTGIKDTNQTKPNIDYKAQYRYLKRKLKYLIYENEFFQDALRTNQRRLLKVSRDRSFLLDRLLQYERPENSSSESDETEESTDDDATREMKKKIDQNTNNTSSGSNRGRKKKINLQTSVQLSKEKDNTEETSINPLSNMVEQSETNQSNQILTNLTETELEEPLPKRSAIIDMMPERASATVPTEMFSNETASMNHEISEPIALDVDSPINIAAEECVPMEYSN